MNQLLDELRKIVGSSNVLTESSLIEPFATDWTGHYSSAPMAVVRVSDRTQVSQVLEICNTNGVAVIPQGGNTGLVGGAVGGTFNHVILSTKNLRSEIIFDPTSNQIIVDAGFTLGEVQKFAREKGLEYNVDLGARDAATIGGTVATNAGGMRVVAYGMTSTHVIGVEVVLPSGEIIDSLSGLPKNNTGFDVTRLFIGSEGTLGVITRVRLQLSIPRETNWTCLIPVYSISDAISIVRPHTSQILAAELMETDSINEIATSKGVPTLGGRTDWWLLAEGDGELPELPEATIVAIDASDVKRVWDYRESHTGYINRLANSIKIDVCVPVDSLQDFIAGVKNAWSKYGAQKDLWIFGHVMDGNLHLAVSNCIEPTDFIDDVMNLVVKSRGAVSAEHGIGRAKPKYLPAVKSPVELETMKAIKKVFDQNEIMNPGVIFELKN